MAFLYARLNARLYGDRDTDPDGQLIYMKPPRVIVKRELPPGKDDLKKEKQALYGMRTSPMV